MSSPRSISDGQWSPPPRFQEYDEIYAAERSPQTYSNPNSPPAVSPQLHEYSQPEYRQQSPLQHHEGYPEGYNSSP